MQLTKQESDLLTKNCGKKKKRKDVLWNARLGCVSL